MWDSAGSCASLRLPAFARPWAADTLIVLGGRESSPHASVFPRHGVGVREHAQFLFGTGTGDKVPGQTSAPVRAIAGRAGNEPTHCFRGLYNAQMNCAALRRHVFS